MTLNYVPHEKLIFFDLTDRIDVSIPTLNQLPCLTVCTDRKLSLIPRSNTNAVVSLLLLLLGDVSLNPGLSFFTNGNIERLISNFQMC